MWVPYLFPTVQKVTETRNCSLSREYVMQFKSTAVLHYVEGVSEPLRRCLQQQGIGADFRSDTTLRSTLVKTGRPMQERMKEHERDEVPLHEWLCKNSIYMQNKTFCAWQHSFNCSSTEVIKYKANFRLSDFMESRNRIYKRYFQAWFFEREIYLSTKRCFWWTLALW